MYITKGFTHPKMPTKETLKINIVDLLAVGMKGELSFGEKHEHSVLDVKDSGKVGSIPNKIFSLVITANMVNFDVSRILIGGGSS